MPATYYTGSKALRAETLKNNLQFLMQYPDYYNLLEPKSVMDEVFKLSDVAGYESLYKDGVPDEERQIIEENNQMSTGAIPPSAPEESHQMHIDGHMEAVAALDQAVDSMSPELARAVKNAFQVHVAGHQMYLQGQEAQESQATGAAPGPVPTPQVPGPSAEAAPVQAMERGAFASPVEEQGF